MALKKRGKYGDAQADIRDELKRVGKLNEYVPTQFADARCVCGNTTFRLRMDEDEGAAVRICTACGEEHAIGDSDEYLDEAELQEHGCVCGQGGPKGSGIFFFPPSAIERLPRLRRFSALLGSGLERCPSHTLPCISFGSASRRHG